MVHAYGSYFSFTFPSRHPELLAFPDLRALETLGRLDVHYILIETAPPYTQDAESLLQRMADVPCLQKVTTQGTIEVYKLASVPPCGSGNP